VLGSTHPTSAPLKVITRVSVGAHNLSKRAFSTSSIHAMNSTDMA
jgi:hypothetical protein